MALVAAGHIAVTPFFIGSRPATVRDGLHEGLRGAIASSPARERDLCRSAGLALSAMAGTARNLVEALIDRFVGTLAPDLATAQKRRVIEQKLGRFRFAWAGTLAPGQAHCFRVHRPVTLIEHDSTQNNASHIHSVWRDLTADFGNDALAEHYRRERHCWRLRELDEERPVIRCWDAVPDPGAGDPGCDVRRDEDMVDAALAGKALDTRFTVASRPPGIDQA